MERLREELGPEAIILSTKELTGNTVEVFAGLEVQAEARGPVIMLDQVVAGEGQPYVEGQKTIENIFISQGLDAGLRQKLLAHSDTRLLSQGEPLDKIIGDSLMHLAHFDPTLPRTQRVVALVGAPGVGKTTTIAKLAAQMHAAFHLRIGLIAADSFKVGAGFHLQTYASIMHMPFKLLDPKRPFVDELRKALQAFSSLDLVFVDTPGCGVREGARIGELARNLEPFGEIERMLVLPAPSNDVDLCAVARAHEPLKYQRLVLSKVDESAYIGPAINTALKVGKAFAFFTTGQRVPEDIEPASARRLGWMLTRTIH